MTEERKIGLEEWQESRCPDCGGSGEAEVEGGRGEDWHQYIVNCPTCGGTGDANAPCVQTCGDISCAVVCKKAAESMDCFAQGCNGCENCIDDLDEGMHRHYNGGW